MIGGTIENVSKSSTQPEVISMFWRVLSMNAYLILCSKSIMLAALWILLCRHWIIVSSAQCTIDHRPIKDAPTLLSLCFDTKRLRRLSILADAFKYHIRPVYAEVPPSVLQNNSAYLFLSFITVYDKNVT